MKIKMIVITLLLAVLAIPVIAQVSNDGEGASGVVIKYEDWLKSQKDSPRYGALSLPLQPLVSDMQPRIFLLSVCATNTPTWASSQVAVMDWMWGVPVANDRTQDPVAIYNIPANGFQIQDACSSLGPTFWNGKFNPTGPVAGQMGHRMIVPVKLTNDVTKFWCRLTSTSTNLAVAYFNISSNSSGGLLNFNDRYMGIWFGPNRMLQSFRDPATHQVVQGGDDIIYTTGSPEGKTYDVVLRLGASVTFWINNMAQVNPLVAEFAHGAQSYKAELIYKNGNVETVVDSCEVNSGKPTVSCVNDSQGFRVNVASGQEMLVYKLQSTADLANPSWSIYRDDYRSVRGYWPLPANDARRFFRIYSDQTFYMPPAN